MHLVRTYNDDKNIQLHCCMQSQIKPVGKHTRNHPTATTTKKHTKIELKSKFNSPPSSAAQNSQ